MELFTDLFKSMDGNIIEYCILGGIVVLIVILIASIVSCAKSLKGDKKRKYSIIDFEKENDSNIDPIAELISEANNAKIEADLKEEEQTDVIVDCDVEESNSVVNDSVLVFDEEDDSEVSIASKIDVPDVIELNEEHEVSKHEHVMKKLDIKSITEEMEMKLEEEQTSAVEKYEDEQEKTAIISYKELVEAAARIEASADKEEDFLDDVVFEFSSKKIADDESSEVVVDNNKKRFVPTLDISPVFGKKNSMNVIEEDDLLEIHEVDISEETHENEDFLKNLQKFRNNLD